LLFCYDNMFDHVIEDDDDKVIDDNENCKRCKKHCNFGSQWRMITNNTWLERALAALQVSVFERLPTSSGCCDMALKRSAPRIAEYYWIMVHKAAGTQMIIPQNRLTIRI